MLLKYRMQDITDTEQLPHPHRPDILGPFGGQILPPMMLQAAQDSSGKRTKPNGSLWTRPWQALVYTGACRESMEILEVLSEGGKGGGPQLCTKPGGKGRKQSCLLWFEAFFPVLILTLVKAGALQLLLFCTSSHRSTDPPQKLKQPTKEGKELAGKAAAGTSTHAWNKRTACC